MEKLILATERSDRSDNVIDLTQVLAASLAARATAALPSPHTVFEALTPEQERSVTSFAALNSDEPPQRAIDAVCFDLHQNPDRFAREFIRMRMQLKRLADQVQ